MKHFMTYHLLAGCIFITACFEPTENPLFDTGTDQTVTLDTKVTPDKKVMLDQKVIPDMKVTKDTKVIPDMDPWYPPGTWVTIKAGKFQMGSPDGTGTQPK